jgi:hypothetical protein
LIDSSIELLELRHKAQKKDAEELGKDCDAFRWAQHYGYLRIRDTLVEYKETIKRSVIYPKPYRPKPHWRVKGHKWSKARK